MKIIFATIGKVCQCFLIIPRRKRFLGDFPSLFIVNMMKNMFLTLLMNLRIIWNSAPRGVTLSGKLLSVVKDIKKISSGLKQHKLLRRLKRKVWAVMSMLQIQIRCLS
jgi:hypothetical protein